MKRSGFYLRHCGPNVLSECDKRQDLLPGEEL